MQIKFSDLSEIREKYKDKTIVFARGTFDLIHIEHVKFFRELKSNGEIVVIGVASDESVTKRKGKERPINELSQRLEIVGAMENVDYVFEIPHLDDKDDFNSGKTTKDILSRLRPNIFMTQYSPWHEKKKEIKEKYGTAIVPFKEGVRNSTTKIIKTVIERHKN